ncbi:hypothetical protein APHAL10511_004781 [Amanita phalloides]|nr:hypothetical protein APHAL10511_004781 [Amanita phalloides]
MPKLHLKRTPEEEAARRLRRKERKEKRKNRLHDETEADYPTSKRRRAESTAESTRKSVSSDEDYLPDRQPSNRYKQDYDTIRADVEERMFREKMFSTMEDEDRLDSIEARLNDYAHVPGRWRRGSSSTKVGIYAYEELEGMDDCTCVDPHYMDDEEYTEWIRMGMYRLKHAEEHAEQERRKAAHAARMAEVKKRKAETAKLEREAADKRKLKRREREEREWMSARQLYDQRWKALLSDQQKSRLAFVDIPWPVLNAYGPETKMGAPHTSLEDLTEDAIRNFLFPLRNSELAEAKEKRDKLRETMLRFHPDKFEGRVMKLVTEGEQARVREGIAQVVRVVNGLLTVIV